MMQSIWPKALTHWKHSIVTAMPRQALYGWNEFWMCMSYTRNYRNVSVSKYAYHSNNNKRKTIRNRNFQYLISWKTKQKQIVCRKIANKLLCIDRKKTELFSLSLSHSMKTKTLKTNVLCSALQRLCCGETFLNREGKHIFNIWMRWKIYARKWWKCYKSYFFPFMHWDFISIIYLEHSMVPYYFFFCLITNHSSNVTVHQPISANSLSI